MTTNPASNADPSIDDRQTADLVDDDSIANIDHWRHDDGTPESFAEFVIVSVSASVGVDPLEMSPLSEAIDPAILTGLSRTEPGNHVEVHFTWSGHDVTVTSDGEVLVHDEE